MDPNDPAAVAAQQEREKARQHGKALQRGTLQHWVVID